ncbi:MAG TPA: hypothetical protein VFY45_21015 [Baekduia sp.]|nr:hypothetical protein [Baekduia sp.]
MAADPAELVGQAAESGLAAARVGVHALMHPREAVERSRAVIDLLVRDELIAAPSSSLKCRSAQRAGSRPFASNWSSCGRSISVRRQVNDVVLCAATGAVRGLLHERGEDPPRRGLRAMVRREADPLRRYELVRAAAEKRKAGGQALAASALTGLTELAPPVLPTSLARSLFAKKTGGLSASFPRGQAAPGISGDGL